MASTEQARQFIIPLSDELGKQSNSAIWQEPGPGAINRHPGGPALAAWQKMSDSCSNPQKSNSALPVLVVLTVLPSEQGSTSLTAASLSMASVVAAPFSYAHQVELVL